MPPIHHRDQAAPPVGLRWIADASELLTLVESLDRALAHLGLGSKAQNLSLTPGFLCGRSLGPFGTHFIFGNKSVA
jgi:hypothetical protein